MNTWKLELRRSDNGNIDGYDTLHGTLEEVYQYSREWLLDMEALVSYPQEILVIDASTEETIYYGNFKK